MIAVTLLVPLGCSFGAPDLDDLVSDEALEAEYPRLEPLGPLLAEVERPGPRDAAAEGRDLLERGERLRARAARLRNRTI